ncbi:MAG: chemotaxis response regulator protein-glutamate methylesterase [Thermodesulfobacteriota bacterium]
MKGRWLQVIYKDMDNIIRVLVVDDSAFNRRALTKILEEAPNIKVVGTASNGLDALKEVKNLKPDLVTLDLEMPVMDGFTFLRIQMNRQPVPIIVVSSRDGSEDIFRALEMGAVDFLPKPTKNISPELFNIRDNLLAKIAALPHLRLKKMVNVNSHSLPKIEKSAHKPQKTAYRASDAPDVVAIGTSTGGPRALHHLLSQIDERLPVSLVISQHMPAGFTGPFAERLNRDLVMKVKEAKEGDLVEKGEVLIAPGGYNLTFRKTKTGEIKVKLLNKTEKERYTPSVDLMFSSVAEVWDGKIAGVVLTGMGRDGKKGIVKIKEKGGYTIAESKKTALIFGMPEAAISSGAVDEVLPLDSIGPKIVGWYKKR